MSKPYHGLGFLLLMLILQITSSSALALTSDAPSSYFQLATEYRAFIDSSHQLSVQQAASRSASWTGVKGASVNQGYSEHPLWLRMDVDVQTGRTLQTMLELGSPFLDNIDFYLVEWQGIQANVIDHQQGGDHHDFALRLQQNRLPLFAVNFPRSGHYSLMLRVQSASALLFPLQLQYNDQFIQNEMEAQIFHGLYFGMILVLAYFNLMLLVYLRERTFVHNFFFVLSIGLYEAGLSGFGYRYVWHDYSWINDHVMVLSALISFFFGGLFAMQFLELKTRAPWLHKVASVLMGCFVIVAVFTPFTSEERIVMVTQILSLATAVFAFAVMFQQIMQRNPWAMYLLLGWSVTIGGYCVFVLSMLGWLQFSVTILNLQALGLAVGNVLVTTAIASRVRRERHEKTSALHQALELSQEVARLTREKEHLENTANQQLQMEVEQKTLELNKMLEYLQTSNRRLERDSQSDPLTGLHNRRYLDGIFPDTIAQCIKHRSCLGVLVIDADHFKKINDNYGHLAGDEVLRKLGTILQKYCRRNLDILVRYGGEEFVMLLPATDLEGVLKIAESIRHHVQYAQFWFEDQKVPVTVSMGVHVCIPPVHATPENMMHKADEALYLAKSNGRNRVEVYKSRFEVVKA